MALLPLPGPTVGLATNTNTPTTTYYSWFRSLFDTIASIVSALAAQFPAGVANTAWTTYTPTVTSGGGTITTKTATGTYFQIGKIVFLEFTVTITTVGTATGDLIVTVPVTPVARDQFIGGVETVVGNSMTGAIMASDLKAHITRYDTTTIIFAGRTIVCAGFYEAA